MCANPSTRLKIVLCLLSLAIFVTSWPASAVSAEPSERITGFCIDFNWAPGGSNGFASPGLFAKADPKAHFQWYKDLGVNTIQTFCVSCDGYAWYRDSRPAPVEPGLKHDFLKEITALGHDHGMRVMGYFCVGANTYWAQQHPELSYGADSNIHIPFTTEYLDYLSACIKDVLIKTGIDGFMIDWVFSPPTLMKETKVRWLPCEQQMYAELFGRPFPGKDKIGAKEELAFQRRALDRCWQRIHEAAKSTNPKCIIWLSCFDLRHPQVVGSKIFQEVDWLMNENPDPTSLAAVRKEAGPHTKIMQCLCGWGDKHDPRRVVGNPKYDDVGFYGFAAANPATTLPFHGTKGDARNVGDARNIEVLRDVFHNKMPK
jgi:uncharacterized lipoprotein YddW (UPF0748 family)